MFRCKSSFDFKTEEYEEDTPLITAQEGDERKEAELTGEEPKPISEGEDSSDDEDINDPVTVIEDEYMMESQRVAPLPSLATVVVPTISVSVGKRRQRSVSVDSDDKTSPYLPSYEDDSGTQRRARLRGARKRTKLDDDQWKYH